MNYVKLNVYPTTRNTIKILAALRGIDMAELIDELAENEMLANQDKLYKTLPTDDYEGEGTA